MNQPAEMIAKRSKGKGNINRWMLFIIVAVVFVIFSIVLPETYPTGDNIMTFLRQASIYGSVIVGVTWVLAVGEMDVSFSEIAAFSSVLFAVLMKQGLSLDLSAIVAIICGSVFGLLNGLLITKVRLQSLIVTIAVSGIAKALALTLGKGTTVPIVKDEGSVFYNLFSGTVGGIPIIFIVMLVVVIVMMIVQEKTRFGQYIYAIGDNKEAATVTGVNTGKIVRTVYLIAAVFAGFGGVLITLMVNSGQPTVGSTLFLDSFTKMYLGAMLFKLGKPNVLGTFVGAILMAMLVNGLTQIGTPSYISQIITGALLIVGVTLTSVLQMRRKNALELGI